MTWNSGPMDTHSGAAYVNGVRIDDADVRADERDRVALAGSVDGLPPVVRRSELDRLLVSIAQTSPGVVAKLRMLWGDIEVDVPPPHTLLALAKVLTAMARGLELRADAPLSPR